MYRTTASMSASTNVAPKAGMRPLRPFTTTLRCSTSVRRSSTFWMLGPMPPPPSAPWHCAQRICHTSWPMNSSGSALSGSTIASEQPEAKSAMAKSKEPMTERRGCGTPKAYLTLWDSTRRDRRRRPPSTMSLSSAPSSSESRSLPGRYWARKLADGVFVVGAILVGIALIAWALLG